MEEEAEVVEVDVVVDEAMDDVEVVDVVEVDEDAVLEVEEAIDDDEVVEDEPEGSGAHVSDKSPASLKVSPASPALTSNLAV